jgi:hypothetical protein
MQVTWDVEDGQPVPIVEVELEDITMSVAGFPAFETFDGFAVSQPGTPKIDFVGFVDSQGNRIELGLHEQDAFSRAARDALLDKARRSDVEATFQSTIDSLCCLSSASLQREYGTYWGRP